MNREELVTLGRKMLDEHGFHHWKIGFCGDKTTVAWCKYQIRTVEFSTHYLPVLSDYDIIQTMLHEIAHIYTPKDRGHGPEWKKVAKRIGYHGKRILREGADRPEGKILGICPAGHTSYKHKLTHNLRHSTYSCGKCSRKFDPKNFITYYLNEEYKRGYAIPLNQGVVANWTRANTRQTPIAAVTTNPPATQRTVSVPQRQKVPPTRAAEYDQGSSVINWD